MQETYIGATWDDRLLRCLSLSPGHEPTIMPLAKKPLLLLAAHFKIKLYTTLKAAQHNVLSLFIPNQGCCNSLIPYLPETVQNIL